MRRGGALVAIAVTALAAPARADDGSGSGGGSAADAAQRAADDLRARQQVAYDYDHAEHVTLAHERALGHTELLVGALLAIGGAAIFAIDTKGTPAAVGGGLAIGGACALVVGAITTIQGADPNPVIPPPPPARMVAWRWRF